MLITIKNSDFITLSSAILASALALSIDKVRDLSRNICKALSAFSRSLDNEKLSIKSLNDRPLKN